jgi:hypothetical protein
VTHSTHERRGLLLSLALILLPAGLGAQETQQVPPPPPDSTELVFQREVFAYPVYERRNPFQPLVGTEGGGPRYEDLVLRGIVYSPDPSRSVALFGVRTGMAAGGEGEATAQSYRVRRGDVLGNVQILEIQQTRVVVEVTEFGLTERQVMELQRLGQGGSS